MRFVDSILGQLLKPISRRRLAAVVERHGANAYDKTFDSWQHLVALIYAQLSGATSLRQLMVVWNANAPQHYHLGMGPLRRSTLSDANARRPLAVFAETFAALAVEADRTLRREGCEMVRLIDASPVPLPAVVDARAWNGRIKGMKLHVVYDPGADVPRCVDITPANVNDIQIGRDTKIEAGATLVFDKGYCSYPWWTKLHENRAFFITRPKTNARFRSTGRRPLAETRGDGFEVGEDCQVRLASKGDSRLDMPLRRIKVRRDGGGKLTLITNDMTRPAVAIAALYKARWQIELLFRWIKQHLNLRTFLGRNDNAIRLQILAAMIAYVLLRLAARQARARMPAIRFADLVQSCLFVRKPLAHLDKPPDPDTHPSRPLTSPDQLNFGYA
jgi:putative transposase